MLSKDHGNFNEMSPSLFALCVSCLLLGKMADTTALNLSSALRFASVNIGEDVTLECLYEDTVAAMFYWYKQAFGEKPQLVSQFYKHHENGVLNGEFNNYRFEVKTGNGKNHLKISYVQLSDSATYYCISGYTYMYDFIEGTIISVKGSDVNVPALVQQSESIQPGGSETLNCTVQTGTCDGEHRVYWFRISEESHPGLIYTHGGSNDQCEKKPNTQTQTCVYNLPMKSLDLSHDGTYYCAVVSCGHILFGDKIKLDSEDEEDSLVLVYFLSGALTFTTILAVVLACTACTIYKTNICKCSDSQAGSPAPNAEGCQDADSLHYAALREIRTARSTRQRDDTWSECVYSSVRQ